MEYEDWFKLHNNLHLAQDTGKVKEYIDSLDLRTLDGVRISLGMAVVDYDMRDTTVEGVQSIAHDGTVWFKTGTGMFDAGRMWAVKP